MKNIIILLSFLIIGLTAIFLPVSAKSIPRHDSLQISLITSGPGNDLYTTFGHSAVRVQDFSTGRDYVFNYGTFDFSTNHFYWKFVRGRLMYFLSVSDFKDFLQNYKAEGRKLTEQVLNLSAREKTFIFNYLKNNYLPQHRFYKYDFLFDNCATRIRDIIDDSYADSWKIDNIVPTKGLTFRDIINQYLKTSPWESLGINLMFGVRADQEVSSRELMFLPHFLMEGFQHSTINGKPLVKEKAPLFIPSSPKDTTYPFYKQPLLWFSLLCAFILILSFTKASHFSNVLLPWVDRCLFFLTGLLGCFLLFMWFGTDHGITKWNYNLLWLFPFNIIFSFSFFKDKRWVRMYAMLIVALCLILLAGYFLLPQQLPFVTLPFITVLGIRSLKIIARFQRK